jgi:hypothetical protein
MNKINKILIISVMCGFFLLNFSLAENTDCWYFARMTYNQGDGFDNVNHVWETKESKFSNFLDPVDKQTLILTKNDLNTAMLNLKKYCCDKNI